MDDTNSIHVFVNTLIGIGCTSVVGVFAWFLNRLISQGDENMGRLAKALEDIREDLTQLTATDYEHENSLDKLGLRVAYLEKDQDR